MSLKKRLGYLEELEAQLAWPSGPPVQSAARARMVAHLDRIADIRRGAEVSDEERAELAEIEKALERRKARERRLEGRIR